MTDNQAKLIVKLLEEYGEWYHKEYNKFSFGSRKVKPELKEFTQKKVVEIYLPND